MGFRVLMLFEKQTELIRQLVDWQIKQDEHTKEQIRLLSEINARQDNEGETLRVSSWLGDS